jgi:hypothetical protein
MSVEPKADSGETEGRPVWIQESLAGLGAYGRSRSSRRGRDRWWLRMAEAARSWPAGEDSTDAMVAGYLTKYVAKSAGHADATAPSEDAVADEGEGT